MKKLSLPLLSDTVTSRRKALRMTQAELAKRTKMNRSMLSKLETQEYTPSIPQLQALAEVLCFEPTDLFIDPDTQSSNVTAPSMDPASNTGIDSNNSNQANTEASNSHSDTPHSYKIAVAGTGYVGLSLAVLLAQHNDVTAVDIIPEKVEKLNNFVSPIQDEYIEKYLAEAKAGTRELHLRATTDG